MYSFFLVISRCLDFICRRFGKICLFHFYIAMLAYTTYEDGTVFRNVGVYNSSPGNYPEERKQHSEHGESLKSEIKFIFLILQCSPTPCYSPDPTLSPEYLHQLPIFKSSRRVFFSLNVRDQVLLPYVTGKSIVLYFMFC